MSIQTPLTPGEEDGWQPGEHAMVAAAGLRFHIVTSGAGPVVLLVTGFPQSAYAWRRVAPLLAEDYTVIAVDLPGQGDSDKPADGYDTLTTAHRLYELLEVLSHRQVVYVGHDIGAWVGYAFAHEYPETLRGLALIDGNIPGISLNSTIELGPENWRAFHFLFNAIPDLPEALLTGRERVLLEWFFHGKTASVRQAFSRADIDEYERVYAAPGGLRGMLGYYRAVLEDIEIHTRLKQKPITVPLLALAAGAGSAPDLYERLRPLGADVRGGVIEGSGHYIPEERPEALAAELRAFIETLPADERR